MIGRAVDVVAQFATPLILVLVAIPMVAGGFGAVEEGGTLVEASIWAQAPVIGDRGLNFALFNSPADTHVAVVQEMIATDNLVEEFLRPAAQGATWPPPDLPRLRMRFRQSFKAVSRGPDLIVFNYHCDFGASTCLAIMGGVIERVGERVGSLWTTNQLAPAASKLETDLPEARRAFDGAEAALRDFADAHGRDPAVLARDSTFAQLSRDVQAKSNAYLRLAESAQQDAARSTSARRTVQRSMRVVDPPAVRHEPLSWRLPAVRYFLAALAATAWFELLLVYMIVRHDDRVRTHEDVLGVNGGRYVAVAWGGGRHDLGVRAR